MSRNRLPLEMQKGHITTINQVRRENEEKSVSTGKDQIKRPPDWVTDDIAVREWKRITKELRKIDIVGNLDRDSLGGYCNALAMYIRATQELQGAPLTVKKVSGASVTTVQNPLIAIQRQYAAEMRNFAKLCGLTIDSRLKAAAIQTKNTEDAIEKEFGAI